MLFVCFLNEKFLESIGFVAQTHHLVSMRIEVEHGSVEGIRFCQGNLEGVFLCSYTPILRKVFEQLLFRVTIQVEDDDVEPTPEPVPAKAPKAKAKSRKAKLVECTESDDS